MAESIETLSVQISASTAKLSEGLSAATDKVAESTDKINGSINEMAVKSQGHFDSIKNSLKAMGETFIAAFAVNKITEFVKHTAELGASFINLNKITGMSVENLSRLRFAASTVGVSWEEMSGGLERLSRNLVSAREATSANSQTLALQSVGIDRAQLANMSLQQVLEQVAKRFHATADGSTKAAIAQQLFGRAGAGLIPILDLGTAGLKKLSAKADELGITMGTQDAQAANSFSEQMHTFHAQLEAVEVKIGEALIPVLSQLLDIFSSGVADVTHQNTTWTALGNAVRGVAAAFELVVGALEVVYDTVKVVVQVIMDDLMGSLQMLTDALHGRFKQAWNDWKDMARQALGDVADYAKSVASDTMSTLNKMNQTVLGSGTAAAKAQGTPQGTGQLEVGTTGGRAGKGKETKDKLAGEKLKPLKIDVHFNAAEAEKNLEKLSVQVAETARKSHQALLDGFTENWKKILEPLDRAMGQTVIGVIRGTQTWHEGMRKMFASIEEEELQSGERMVTSWAANELAKTTASLLGDSVRTASAVVSATTSKTVENESAISTILAKAWQAAASVYASAADIPFVGWILAPALAIAAGVEVASFVGRIAHAAGGWDRVPQDQLAMVHKNEMVLPANLAEGARQTFTRGGSGGAVNHYHVNALDARSMADSLRRNPAALVAGLRHAVSMGHR